MKQYYSLEKICKVQLEQSASNPYVKKFENKIGIIHEGQDYFYLNYLVNNEEVSDMLFEYETNERSIQNSSYSNEDINLNYCFCGKLKYFFYSQIDGVITQYNLKTQELKNLQLDKKSVISMIGLKNTEYIALSLLDFYEQNYSIEIRDSEQFQIQYSSQNIGYHQITYLNLEKSRITISQSDKIVYSLIRKGKQIQLFSFFRELPLKMIEMENNLMILDTKRNQFLLISLTLHGKILRNLTIFEDNCKFSIKRYQDQYLLKSKAQNWVNFSLYLWWKGQLTFSSKINDFIEGKITSREAKGSVYILKYVDNDPKKKLKNLHFQQLHI